jgi:hypothetical protein
LASEENGGPPTDDRDGTGRGGGDQAERRGWFPFGGAQPSWCGFWRRVWALGLGNRGGPHQKPELECKAKTTVNLKSIFSDLFGGRGAALDAGNTCMCRESKTLGWSLSVELADNLISPNQMG